MTRKIATDFNVAPYYDDFDETKDFLRFLFNPARPVQSRELTQIQTLLNNQMSRLGNHLFNDGSVVIPGGFNIDTEVEYIKLTDASITEADWNGQTVTNGSGGKFKVIIAKTKVSDTEPSTLIGNYISGSTKFSASDSITTGSSNATVASSSFSGKCSVASVDEGIFYISGFFTRCAKQTIILDKYTNTPTYRVGLTVSESIVKSGDDNSLLDVAQGSPNFAGPGADRFKITLTLDKKSVDTGDTITNNASEDFYEFIRLKDGIRTDHIIYPQYSYLGDQLARRLYETSGNFAVRNFPLDVDVHDSDNTKFNTKLKLTVDPGKAYVLGYEIETIYPKTLDLDKARDTLSVDDKNFTLFIGNYVNVKIVGTAATVPSFKEQRLIHLLDTTETKMGTARVRQLQVSASDTFATDGYILNLFDIKLDSGKLIKDFNYVGDTSDNKIFEVTDPSRVAGTTTITSTDKKSLVLPLSHSSVSKLGDISWKFSKYSESSYTGGSISLTLGSGEKFLQDSTITGKQARGQFTVLETTTGKNYEVTSVTFSGSTATISIDAGALGDGSTVSVFSLIEIENPSPRVKTKQVDGDVDIDGTNLDTTWGSLGKADVIKILSIKLDDDTDVTSKYKFDNGQRDTHYEHGKIKLKDGQTVDAENLNVTFEYYSHTNNPGGYFNVDSYDYDSDDYDYADIPSYEDSSGKVHKLADVLDFRPIYPDTGQISDNKTPYGSGTYDITVDYDYYVPRIDKLVLTKEKEFRVIKGIPAENPTSPVDDVNAMTLYVLTVPPYTYSADEVSIKPVQNKRYTMKDIGLLERRLEAIESGEVIDSLVSQARNLIIRDDSGAEVLKNGILVDDFIGHSVGDINDPNYSCSIDFETGELRPAFESNNHSFTLDTANSTNIKKTGPLLTAGYTAQTFLDQPLASGAVKLNPHDMVDWFGDLTLSPNSDTWYSKTLDPKVSINFSGENDAWQVLALSAVAGVGKGFGTQWNDWQSIWTSVDLDKSDDETNPSSIRFTKTELLGRRDTTNGLAGASKINTVSRFLPNRMSKDIVQNKLDVSVVPFMRTKKVTIVSKNLKPNTRFYGYFDSKDVTTDIAISTELTLSSVVGTFNDKLDEWETITDTTSGATGKVLLRTKNEDGVTVLHVGSVVGTFGVNHKIENPGAATTATIDSISTPTNLTSDIFGNLTGTLTIPEASNSKIRTGLRLLRLTDNADNDLSLATSVSENQFNAHGVVADPEQFVISTRLPKVKRTLLSDEASVARDIFLREASNISKNLKWKDPVAQTFVVDRAKYRNGIMLDSLDLFFKAKDDTLPVSVEIRPTSNGFPSTGLIVPFSEVTLLPSDVTVDVGPNTAKATNFKFQAPVYLSPGEYAITVKSNSTVYELYTGEYGIPVLNTDGTVDINNAKVSKQPNVGPVFSSMNAGVWEPNLNKSLMFKLNSCKFTTTASTAEFNIVGLSSGTQDFSIYKLTNSSLDNFFNSTGISFKVKGTKKGDALDTEWASIEPNKNIEDTRIMELSTNSDFSVQATFTTSDENISPVIDMERLSLININNVVESAISLDQNENEDGLDKAQYISRRVKLDTDKFAKDIRVNLDMYKPIGTELYVYVKVHNSTSDTNFGNESWVKLSQITPSYTRSSYNNDYKEFVFGTTTNAGIKPAGFDNFDTYSIKIVMTASNSYTVPKVRKLKAFALNTTVNN